ncbi:unnamed protein product [Thelazia callipaeda]|uniref:Uncharacterized protein n=1 Tax=Thelazia callipaeda TaxID=103827 RepID=A0A0N5D1Z6_THECL|nr:unnamed protein product [Thelazia callipaeda]
MKHDLVEPPGIDEAPDIRYFPIKQDGVFNFVYRPRTGMKRRSMKCDWKQRLRWNREAHSYATLESLKDDAVGRNQSNFRQEKGRDVISFSPFLPTFSTMDLKQINRVTDNDERQSEDRKQMSCMLVERFYLVAEAPLQSHIINSIWTESSKFSLKEEQASCTVSAPGS